MPIVTIGNNSGDDYTGTEDTHIKEDTATTNYGTNAAIEVTKYAASDHTHTLIRFTGLDSITDTIDTVADATSYLYQYTSSGGGNRTVTAKRLLVNWVESEATWNIYSTGNNWTTSGGLSDGNDRSGTNSFSTSITSTNAEYKSFNAAQFETDVKNMVNGSVPNYGWHLERTDAADDSAWNGFRSVDHATTGQLPYIYLDYTAAAAGGGNSNLLLMGVG